MINKDFSSIYFWVHSSLATFSIGYFLALLSSSPETQESAFIGLASFFFCLSLTMNSAMSLFLVWFGDIDDLVNKLYPLYPWHNIKSIPSIAIISFIIGLISLLGFYSFWLLLTSLLSGTVVYYVVGKAYGNLLGKISEEKLKTAMEQDSKIRSQKSASS
ncbi:MAG: hypothetical protein ACTH4U_06010 [Pseudoalteromonas prydzensis]|uniref:hypothetical protein n=1 Tax=Pseudoalteromonas prydzensis TaxID=182141 RepID=UPI003F9E944F